MKDFGRPVTGWFHLQARVEVVARGGLSPALRAISRVVYPFRSLSWKGPLAGSISDWWCRIPTSPPTSTTTAQGSHHEDLR